MENLENFTQGKAAIVGIIGAYNNVRLHSALSFLRPVDYNRGNPEVLLAERRRKLQATRELQQENIKLRQRLISLDGGPNHVVSESWSCLTVIETNHWKTKRWIDV